MERVDHVEDRWSQEQLVSGIELPGLVHLLARHKFGVSPVYFHRLAMIAGISLPSTVLGGVERLVWGRTVANTPIDPVPLFILGHWRSGTTHLHNLLGRDPAHTYSNVWQAVFPGNFLVSGKLGPKLLKNMLTETRTYDAVKQGWFEAAEDEIALLKLNGGLSFYGALLFPDEVLKYEKYVDFHDATEAERTRWKDALELLIRKMMVASGGKRVVVKSCPHSARIPMILDRFPTAKFVHIHRHPARVFASMMHMREKVDWENHMQRPTRAFVDDRRELTARLGERVFTRLIEDRANIPAGNLFELAYDGLCGNEMAVMRKLYSDLGLPGWDAYEPQLQAYVDGLKGYKRNALALDDELQAYVYDRWRVVYDTYGYPKDCAGYL
jgi:hypothetical protein